VIDTNTKKGGLLASLIVGLAAAHAINDEPRSKDIPGAVNLARLLMLGCNRGLQRAVEETFDENRTPDENAAALIKAYPNKEMTTLIKSFSYEQLRDMMVIANAFEMIGQNAGQSVQGAAAELYPAQFRKDMEEAEQKNNSPVTIHVIDLSSLFSRPVPQHPFSPPTPDVHS
jgi:hypothetical protein